MAYNLTLPERETTVRWDAEERIAHIYTADPVYIRRLDKLVEQFPDVYKLVIRDQYGAKYTVPNKYVRFGKPASEAQKAAARLAGQNSQFSNSERRRTPSLSDSDSLDE